MLSFVNSRSISVTVNVPFATLLRVGEPADIVRTIDFLCDERNTFINGENITVDGGMSKLMVYHNDCGWTYRP